MSPDDFEHISLIGRGAFAEVKVVRKKDDGQIYAMKVMSKADMVNRKQVDHIRAERDILSVMDSPWIVKLLYSFQDDNYLYLVMDFLQGGDLMTILINKEILTVEETRFYIAETALAIHAVHSLGYLHRDLKPDNILIDNDGHVKLSDFGLCKAVSAADAEYVEPPFHQAVGQYTQQQQQQQQQQYPPGQDFLQLRQEYRQRTRKLAFSTVGTPDYIAPEVFAHVGYDQGCDWWSLGVILYECLIGCPPFFSEDSRITCSKIINFRQNLQFPSDVPLDRHAYDLISRLICDREYRLTFDDIRRHPFFAGIDWNSIRRIEAPNIPTLSGPTDTRYFEQFDHLPPPYDPAAQQPIPSDPNNPFINYTFQRHPKDHQTPTLNDLFSQHQQ